MTGQNKSDWFKESFEKGKEEFLKFAKSSRIKIEVATLKKKREERVKLLGNRVLEMIKNGELDAEKFEPDYASIVNADAEISEKETEIEEIVPDRRDERTGNAESAHADRRHAEKAIAEKHDHRDGDDLEGDGMANSVGRRTHGKIGPAGGERMRRLHR